MRLKTLLTTTLLFIAATIFAQETVTISGVVRDENKKPLPGATVQVKGTSIGTVTDDAGKYTLKVPKDSKTLLITFIGYDNREIAINTAADNTVDVNMATVAVGLNQVVVSVSKRTEKLIDAPASISVIGQQQLERNVVTTPVDELKTTPGVDIMRTGLISSNVVVRGFNNIFSGSVLNVVDNRIAGVPSLRINAYQLVPLSTLDYDKIEVVRGPASALYGPNASSGVISIMTKSPLDQDKKFETTIAMTSGFTVLDKSYKGFNSNSVISGNIINPEFRHSGKLFNGKFGYKISGSYFQGKDYPNYDPREPYTGDSLIFGSVRNGQIFRPDSVKTDTGMRPDIRRFNKDFFIRKWNADGRIDIRPIKDITITLNGGVADSRNVELTGLGAGAVGGDKGGWMYWYVQARFKWKNLFVQYYLNSSNAGNTYLIPQLSDASRQSYNSSSPPNPYPVQLLIDKSKLHVIQVQHSVMPVEQLNLVYGVDVQLTRPNTEGTINGRFEDMDNLNIIGGYVQADYKPLKWLQLVAAMRVDYNSIIKNVAPSPRAAIVFKPAENQSIRITYNRAFDSPTTLNQFLDLSNGLIPNGINVRGIGNPYGWKYNYDDNGVVQFHTAPWGGGYNSGSWVTYGDNSQNARLLDSLINYLANQFATTKGSPLYGNLLTAKGIVNNIFKGISGANGTATTAGQQELIDYANLAQTKDLPGSIQNVNQFKDLQKINNSYTNTLELGYKGFWFGKLSVQVDAYWTRINNYVSALTSASGAVMLNHESYLGKYDYANNMIDTTGILYKNLHQGTGLLNTILTGALDGAASLQNPSIVPSIKGTAWDELVVLTYQFPLGTVTPNDSKYIGSDYILTYKNLGRLDVFGIDLGLNYNILENTRHMLSAGASLSWVDKDKIVLSSGEEISLNAPKVKASAMMDHVLKKSGFGYGLTFRYQMPYDAASAIYVGHVNPAYLLDARVSWKPNFYKGLLLSINVNNVTNYQWSAFPGTPLTGTQFYARAQVTF